MAVAEQMKKLMGLNLKKDRDPEDLGDWIAEIETAYRCVVDDKQKVAAIVNAAGMHYAAVISGESKRIEAAGNDVTCEDLIDAMSEAFRVSGGGKAHPELSEPTETVLANTGSFAESRECYKCGVRGHIATNCKNEGKVKFTGKCNMCGQKGHKEERCWEDRKNEHLRPHGWTSRKAEAEGANVEILVSVR